MRLQCRVCRAQQPDERSLPSRKKAKEEKRWFEWDLAMRQPRQWKIQGRVYRGFPFIASRSTLEIPATNTRRHADETMNREILQTAVPAYYMRNYNQR